MAKQIKSTDIFEDDIFKNIRESAEKTIETIEKINAEFKQTGEALKKSIGGAKFDSSKSINEFVKAQSQANKLSKEAIQLQKAKAEAERQMALATAAGEKASQQAVRTEREKLKLDQDLARQTERKAKAEEKAAKAARDEANAYKQLERNTRELKNQSKELAAQMLVLERNGEKNSKAYFQLAARYKEVTRAAQQGDAQLKRIDKTVGDNFRNVGNYQSAIGGLKNALGQLGLAFGIGSVVRGAGETIIQFDKQIGDLKAITDASGDDLKFFKEQAIELGKSVEGGASQVIEAYKLIGSAKPELLSNAEALDSVTQAAITLSQASGLELTDAATRLTDAMNQFGAPAEDAGKFIDVLANGALFGSAAIPDVTDALLKFGAAANTSNVSLEESTALIELLASKGLKGAEAGTALRNVMLKLSAPDALPKEAVDRLTALGISMDDLKDTSKPFSERLDALKPLLNDNAALVKVFGTENAIAATNLLRGTDAVRQLTKDMEKQGTAQKQANDNTNTLSHAFNELKESWNAMILELTSGDGMSFVVDGIKFIAANLGTIIGLLAKAAIAWGTYKTALIAIQAKQYLFNGGLKETIKGMGDVFKSAKKAGEGAKEMGNSVGNAGRSMSAIPWVAIIGAVIELATSFYDVASGAKRAREQAERLGNYQAKANEVATENIKKQLDALGKLQSQRKRDYDLAIAQAKTEADKKKATEDYIKLREQDIAKTRDQLRAFKDEVLERKKGYNEQLKQAENIQKMQQSGSRSQEELAARMRQTLATELGLDPQLAKTLDIIDVLNAKLSASNVKIDEYGNTIIELNEDLKDLNSELKVNSIEHEDNTGKINAKIPKLKEHQKAMKGANDEIERMNSLMKETESLIDEIAAFEAEQNIQSAVQSQLDAIGISGKYTLSIINQTIDAEYKLQKTILDRIYLEAIESATTEQEILNARLKYNFELEKLDQETADKRKDIREELEMAQEDWIEKNRDNEIDANKDIVESDKETAERRMEYFKLATDYFKKQSDERIKQYEKEISKAEEQYNTLQELAKNGNINAKESLAEQQRIINEANAKKEKEQRRQARLQLLETAFSTYNQKVASNSKNPLAETIRDIGLLRAFIDTLPAYYDGTEDTGQNGNGVDGKGGFHAILHPNERVIPKSLNDKIGDLSNEQLTKIAMDYQNGKTIRGNEQIASAFDTMLLVQKIDELNSTIKNKPETNIELGEITQSAMNIVKSVKKGNTTIYNRYRIKP